MKAMTAAEFRDLWQEGLNREHPTLSHDIARIAEALAQREHLIKLLKQTIEDDDVLGYKEMRIALARCEQ